MEPMVQDGPPRERNLPPGYDEDDPYADFDVDALPAWWRRNRVEFERHDMRPYRPPRFADDALVPEVVESIESTFDVEIQFVCVDPQEGNDWDILINGESVTTVTHEREGEGFTRYGLESDALWRLVQETSGE